MVVQQARIDVREVVRAYVEPRGTPAAAVVFAHGAVTRNAGELTHRGTLTWMHVYQSPQ